MERQGLRLDLVLAAAVLAIGLVVGGYLMGNGLVRARHADRAVTMRGLAERDVTADLATWTLAYSATGGDVVGTQQQIDRQSQIITDMLTRAGFARDEINVAGVNVNQYRNNEGLLNVTSRQRLILRTTKVMAARRAFSTQAALLRQGVALDDGSGIVYSFTKLERVKPEMIAAATKDARRAAEQFAKDSGTSVGAIRQATQGYFSIGARDGENSGSGTDSPLQKVRVVTTIDFYLE